MKSILASSQSTRGMIWLGETRVGYKFSHVWEIQVLFDSFWSRSLICRAFQRCSSPGDYKESAFGWQLGLSLSTLSQILPTQFRKHSHSSWTFNWLWQTQATSSQTLSLCFSCSPPLLLSLFLMVPTDLAFLWITSDMNEKPHVLMTPFILSYLNPLILTALGKKAFCKV